MEFKTTLAIEFSTEIFVKERSVFQVSILYEYNPKRPIVYGAGLENGPPINPRHPDTVDILSILFHLPVEGTEYCSYQPAQWLTDRIPEQIIEDWKAQIIEVELSKAREQGK